MQACGDLLDSVNVASPCSMPWEAMKGDDRIRFCELCKLNVFNLSGMSRGEATKLVQEAEGRLCIQFFRRSDGTILTRDCPMRMRKLRRGVAKIAWGLVALVATILGLLTVECRANQGTGSRGFLSARLVKVEPFTSFIEWLDPTLSPRSWVKGEIALPVPPGKQGPQTRSQ